MLYPVTDREVEAVFNRIGPGVNYKRAVAQIAEEFVVGEANLMHAYLKAVEVMADSD